MTDPTKTEDTAPASSTDRRSGVGYRVLWGVCAVAGLADLFYHKHGAYKIEEFPAFYGLFAFLAAVGLMFVAKGLREIVRQREDYYDR